MDTRTPRPTGGRSPGFDDEPALSTVKVPCDPAQVIVNHASFRVQLATPVAEGSPLADAARLSPVRPGAVAGARPTSGRRRAPVVWSGRSQPGDPAAGKLIQAVRTSGVSFDADLDVRRAAGGVGSGDPGATQVLPRVRIDQAGDQPTVIAPRVPPSDGDLLGRLQPARGAYDDEPYADRPYGDDGYGDGRYEDEPYGGYGRGGAEESDDGYDDDLDGPRHRRSATDPVRHAYYPGRRMNLGVVLLPLRIFLGFISIYAGMGKLCDPVYFDGGERGSMVTWLSSLHPWGVASPLHEFALAHPVGAGLSVAFIQVVVGVLTILGLWQRLAAALGTLLSAALLLTVSWRTLPAYEAPDIIYLAAWSPLIIAGAPVYSLDARLAGEAWRRLGPRVTIWDLRRRVLRRGTIMVTVIGGLTLLVGSMLGGAVRSSDLTTVPGPTDAPRNHLPGSPLPLKPGRTSQGPASKGPGSSDSRRSASPSASAASKAPGAPRETGSAGTGRPVGQGEASGQGSPGVRSPQQPAPPAPPSNQSAGPSSSGGSSSPGGTSGGSGGSGGGSSGGALGGLLG